MDLSNRLDISIEPIESKELKGEIIDRLESVGNPAGALGHLQDVALRIGLIQQNTKPALHHPALLVFAGDHGIAEEEISALPRKFTHQQVLDFLNGGAPINVFSHQSGMEPRLIDVGVDHSFEGTLTYWLHQGSKLFNRKIGYGTRNFLEYPALTTADMEKAMKVGMDMVEREHGLGCNVIGLAEIGVGNTTSAAVICAALMDSSPGDFVISGSSLGAEQVKLKREVVEKALKKHPKTHDPQTILTLYGGYEIAALTGAILRAAEKRMTVLIDGFVSATALLIASSMEPAAKEYCIFCSGGEELGHAKLLKILDARPLLSLELKAGEGNGIALAYPLINNAVRFLNHFSVKD